MQSDLVQGLIIMAVGMTTVFALLSLIVLSGRWLILILNRSYKPEPLPVKSTTPHEDELVIISSIVHHVTQGKGQIISISKPTMKSK